ncbi:unnamed protein product, partial [Pylaiella littoralis]
EGINVNLKDVKVPEFDVRYGVFGTGGGFGSLLLRCFSCITWCGPRQLLDQRKQSTMAQWFDSQLDRRDTVPTRREPWWRVGRTVDASGLRLDCATFTTETQCYLGLSW